MHRDYRDPQYATLEKGQLVIYRGTPDHQEATLFKTPPVSDAGTYKLGITASKRLIIYREVDGKRKTVWMTPKN